ncbi:MAG TPA: hypothetical protein PK413_00590 [Thermoanaerobaculia bacterium]|nr:hypothetical protein [Thermoanaerobaculia bacterium]
MVPNLDVLFPEAEFDLRLNRLIDKVFFEGQVKYDFVDGDITAFLRYRYYGYRRTYQLSVFDSVAFKNLETLSADFERVRGGLFLVQWPHDFQHRTYLVGEVDSITSNKESSNSGKTNIFLRLGYQLGTPDDSRSNAIVGEPRAQVERLFTPFRSIGPGDVGLTTALTWGLRGLGGSFDYVKVEVEALKRFELPRGTFLIGRLHHGGFLRHGELAPEDRPPPPEDDPDDPTIAWAIPRNELFHLDGRNNLKGLTVDRRGTQEVHATWEFLFPWFVDRDRPFLKARWQTWYWVLYSGYGGIGNRRADLEDLGSYVADVGVGFQSSFTVRHYQLFWSALLAKAFEEGSDLRLKFSFKSYH